MEANSKERIKKLKGKVKNMERLYERNMSLAAKHSRDIRSTENLIDKLSSK